MSSEDEIFRALADPSRRLLLERLSARDGQTLGELCQGLGMARQSVSQHLDRLEKAGLLSVQWQGRTKRHLFNPGPLRGLIERWIHRFDRLRPESAQEPHFDPV